MGLLCCLSPIEAAECMAGTDLTGWHRGTNKPALCSGWRMQGNPVWGPVWGPVWLSLGGQRTGGEIYVKIFASYGFFWFRVPWCKKSIYLRCTRELPQTPAGAPVPHGAAGLHAKSGAAWAAWGRDQGPAPSETQHGYFRDRAAHPSMKTLIGCHNDGQGTERVAAQQQLAWPRDAARSTSPRRSFAVRSIRL